MSSTPAQRTGRLRAVALTTGVIVLAVVAGAIHLSLGALIFTLNALGYFALAMAFLVAATVSRPLVVRFSWLPRVALLGYAAASIAAWLVVGGFYWLGYLTKGIEVALIVLLIVDIHRVHGGVKGLVSQAVDSVRWAVAWVRR